MNGFFVFLSRLGMEGGDKAKDKGRAMKLKSAYARRANAGENPHIKRAGKKPPASQSDAAPIYC
jgi:hypothetical protein